jgi:hypothetical protein
MIPPSGLDQHFFCLIFMEQNKKTWMETYSDVVYESWKLRLFYVDYVWTWLRLHCAVKSIPLWDVSLLSVPEIEAIGL